MCRFKLNAYLICIATAMASSWPRPPMVTQRTFNTRLLIYLFIFPFFSYLSTSGLRTSGLIIYLLTSGLLTYGYLFTYFLFTYLVTIYSFIYLFIYIFNGLRPHPLFPPRRGNFVRATMPKPRGRYVTVSSCTMQRRCLLNTTQFPTGY